MAEPRAFPKPSRDFVFGGEVGVADETAPRGYRLPDEMNFTAKGKPLMPKKQEPEIVRYVEEHYNPEAELASFMYMNVAGQIETGDFDMNGFVRCEYAFVSGPEWEIIHGDRTGKSQFARESSGLGKIIWNLGYDVGFRTLSPSGWPQLVLTFIGLNTQGNEVVRGYACIHIPTVPGRHERFVRAFCPIRDGFMAALKLKFKGPECDLADKPETVAAAEGSEVTKIVSLGAVRVNFNIIQRNFSRFGYSTC